MVRKNRFKIQILLMGLLPFITSCDEINQDSPIETSCTQATGLWTMTSATCDGTAITVATSTFTFDPDTNLVTQQLGRVDCMKTYHWNVEIGEQTPLFSMTGQGTITCTQSGQEVNSCTGALNTCHAGVDFSGIRNEYSTCVITEKGLHLSRTVTGVNNPDGLSLCENGQEEEVTLIQGDYTPPVPEPEPEEGIAFLEVDGPDPLNFGTHATGSRIVEVLRVTNIGGAEATNITGTGLAAPFYFLGGEYPGTGGSCGDEPLAIGASCEITVEFFPTVVDYYTDSLILTYNNGSGSVSITHGIAAEASDDLAILSISNGPYYEFPQTAVGDTNSGTLVVTNIGGGDAAQITATGGLTAPYQFEGGAFPGTAGTCTASLASGEQCEIVIDFSPGIDGIFNDIIELDYFDGANTQRATRNVFGEALP